jgi:hypothetical protein
MDGLSFTTAAAPATDHPARADIACFVGFVARRRPAGGRLFERPDSALPATLRAWLTEHDWAPGRHGRSAGDLADLLDVPVPIESWDAFDAHYDWSRRSIDGGERFCDTTMGAAVRAFFARGGRKCHVVRVGDPWPVMAPPLDRRGRAVDLLPAFPPVSATDRSSWRGIGHLHGLPDVSLLVLPDLPDLFAVTPRLRESDTGPEGPEVFVECAARTEPATDRHLRGIPAPRCDAGGFRDWIAFVRRVGGFLQNPLLRQTQFVGAVPLPLDSLAAAGESNAAHRVRAAHDAQWRETASIRDRFVQLAYPWLRARESALLPGNVMPPDGWFAGIVAESTLARGSWRSLIHEAARGVDALEPVLDRATLARDLSPASRRVPLTLRDRITVIGPTGGGLRVLSDVTMDDDEACRPASVHRLLISVLRAARVAGETAVYENNGEALWRRLRESLEGLLASLWGDGALHGAIASEAFEVRCDRTTMTQADLDAGRAIVRASFTAAVPIVHITVVFALSGGGEVTLSTATSNVDEPSRLVSSA